MVDPVKLNPPLKSAVVVPRVEPTEPDPWPELPLVPARAGNTPNTAGGRIAAALDDLADHLTSGPPPREGQLRTDWTFAAGYKSLGAVVTAYPRRQVGEEAFAPTGDATAERDRIDAAFGRVGAAWVCCRERDRRRQVEASEAVFRSKKADWTARLARERAEQMWPAGREVRVDNATKADPPPTGPYDRVVLDLSGTDAGRGLNTAQTTLVTGRVQFAKKFVLDCGPAAIALQGSVGGELHLLVSGPTVVDLTGVQAPVVRIRASREILVRVGPSVGHLGVNPTRGVILARGAPNLRVEYPTTGYKSEVAVVNY